MAASTATVQPNNGQIIFPSLTASTNLGPLPTTTFPSACLATLYDLQHLGFGVPYTYETQGCAVSTCCPYGSFYTEGWAWLTSYYSPGACPAQYRACPPPPTGVQALASAQGETIAFCCPTNYDCPLNTNNNLFLFCQSGLATSTTAVVLDNIYDQKIVSTRQFTKGSFATSFQIAYPIQIRYRSGETIPTSGVVASARGSTTGTTGRSVGGAGGSSSSSGQGSGRHSGLSTGAIVGVAFGAFIGLALLMLGILFFPYKNKKASRRRAEGAMALDSYPSPTGHRASDKEVGEPPRSTYSSAPVPLDDAYTRTGLEAELGAGLAPGRVLHHMNWSPEMAGTFSGQTAQPQSNVHQLDSRTAGDVQQADSTCARPVGRHEMAAYS